MDINTGSGCSKATDPDMAFDCSSGGKQASDISLFLITFASSDLPLSRGHETFCLSLSPPCSDVGFPMYALTTIGY